MKKYLLLSALLFILACVGYVKADPLPYLKFYVDTLANLPSPTKVGQAFAIVTDHSYGLYYSDGTTWTNTSSGGSSISALTGDVTASGTGSVTATVNSVANVSTGAPLASAFGGTACTTANCVPGLPHWSSVLSSVITATPGTANANLCVVADSIGWGYGSASSNYPNLSWPAQLANQLTAAYGVKANFNSFFGAGVNGFNYGTGDSRVTKGSSWSQSTDYISMGVDTFKATTNTNPLSFLPTENVDKFTVYYIQAAGLGNFNVNINGGTNTPVNSNGADGVGAVTITGSLTANTVNITETSGTVYIIGVKAVDSTQNEINVMNAAVAAAKSSDWSDSAHPWSPANGALYTALGCDLTLAALGTNDVNAAVSVATFTANMQAIATAAKTSGDIAFLSAPPEGTGNATVANQALFANANKALATTNGKAPFIDIYTRWGTYAVKSLYGYYFDTIHPNQLGYTAMSNAVARAIMPGSNSFDAASINGLQTLYGPFGNLPALQIFNTSAPSGFAAIDFAGDGQQYFVGAGNSSSANLGSTTAGHFIVYNLTQSKVFLDIDTSGNTTVYQGYFTMAKQLFINGGQFVARGGTNPTVQGSCGTGAAVTGADSSHNLTIGSTATTTCSVNFGAAFLFWAPAVCELQPTNATAAQQSTTGAYISGISTNGYTITGLALANATYGVHCY